MAKSKQERLQKIDEQIAKENLLIAQSKERIKTLTAQKKKLEQQIEEEEYALLRDLLCAHGIKSIDDFEAFVKEKTSDDFKDFVKALSQAKKEKVKNFSESASSSEPTEEE